MPLNNTDLKRLQRELTMAQQSELKGERAVERIIEELQGYVDQGQLPHEVMCEIVHGSYEEANFNPPQEEGFSDKPRPGEITPGGEYHENSGDDPTYAI